jgi:hypothetical protein
MTPIRLEGDDDDDDDEGAGDEDEEDEDEDEDSTPVPRSKRRTAACVFLAHLWRTILTLHFFSVNLLETASSRGLANMKKRPTKTKMEHQSQPTQFWDLNRRVRKLRRWTDCWTTGSSA